MNAYIPTHVNIQIQHFPTPSEQLINYPTKYFKYPTYIYTFILKIIKYPTTKTDSQTHTYTYTYTKSLIHTHINIKIPHFLSYQTITQKTQIPNKQNNYKNPKKHRASQNKNLSLVGLGLRLLTSGFFTSSAG